MLSTVEEREEWTREQWVEAFITGSENSREDGTPKFAPYLARQLCYADEQDDEETPETYEACGPHEEEAHLLEDIIWKLAYRRLIDAAIRIGIDPDDQCGAGYRHRQTIVALILDSFPQVIPDGESDEDVVLGDIRRRIEELYADEDYEIDKKQEEQA